MGKLSVKWKHVICAAMAGAGLAASSGASAATQVVQDGQLTGANGIVIGNTVYDVEFLDGTCVDLFGGCDEASDFVFQNITDASGAARALLDQVLLNTSLGAFDTNPELTRGCTNPTLCALVIPYAATMGVSNPVVFFGAAGNSPNEIQDLVGYGGSIHTNSDSALFGERTFARFSISNVVGVPEPATGAMLLLGFGMMGAIMRQNRSSDRRTAAA